MKQVLFVHLLIYQCKFCYILRVAVCADVYPEQTRFAGIDHIYIVKTQHILRNPESNIFALAGLQGDLLEAAKHL